MRSVLIGAAMLAGTAAAAQTIQPGQWEMTSTVTQMTMAGMPPAVAAMAKGRPNTIRSCVTPEQARSGPREMLKSSPDCKVTRFTMAAGRYASAMQCARGGMATTATSSGTYTPTSMSATSRIISTGDHAMDMTVAVSGRRVGECR